MTARSPQEALASALEATDYVVVDNDLGIVTSLSDLEEVLAALDAAGWRLVQDDPEAPLHTDDEYIDYGAIQYGRGRAQAEAEAAAQPELFAVDEHGRRAWPQPQPSGALREALERALHEVQWWMYFGNYHDQKRRAEKAGHRSPFAEPWTPELAQDLAKFTERALAAAPQPALDVERLDVNLLVRKVLALGGRMTGFEHWRSTASSKPSDPSDIRWECACGYAGSPATVEKHWDAHLAAAHSRMVAGEGK